MIGAVRRGFAGLVDFSGRDRPGVFWPYAGLVIALTFIGITGAMLPSMATTFAKMQRFAVEHPDQATVTRTATSYSIEIQGNHPELAPDLGAVVPAMAIVLAAAVLLAAAVARRLHDRGFSAYWGLMPLPFLPAGFWGADRVFAHFGDADLPIGLFFAVFINNVAYIASLIGLVVLLAGASTQQPNRYGPPPAA